MRTSVVSAVLFFVGASWMAGATTTTSSVDIEEVCADEITQCGAGSTACFTCLLSLSQLNSTTVAAQLPSNVTCEETPAVLCNYVETELSCDTTDTLILDLAACITDNLFGCEFSTCDFTPAPVTVTGAPTALGTSVSVAPTAADGTRALGTAAPTAAPTAAGTVEGLATPSPASETGESATSGVAGSLGTTLMRGSLMGICALVAGVGALVV